MVKARHSTIIGPEFTRIFVSDERNLSKREREWFRSQDFGFNWTTK